MAFTKSNGARIYYRLDGSPSNPLLVFVHSLGADHGMWEPQVTALSPYFRILRIDVRGHGASDSTPGEYSIEQLAKDVLTVVDSVAGNTTFAYCGLSLGGMIGQWLGANTQRITKLMLANTSPRMPDPALFDARRKLVLEQGMASVEEVALGRFFMPSTLANLPPFVESSRAVLLTTNPQGYAACCSAIRDMDQTALLASIHVPTLVIGGTHDQSTPWQGHGNLLAARIPNARAVVFDAAHLSNLERPSEFNAALFDFLLRPAGTEVASA